MTRNTLRQWSASNTTNISMEIDRPVSSLPRVALLAWIEALSPCSLFCLFLFLSFIWLYPDSRRNQIGLGALFIVTLGLLHLLQYVYTPLYYQWLSPYSFWFFWVSGLVMLGFVSRYLHIRWQGFPAHRSVVLAGPVLALGVIAVYLTQSCDFSAGAVFQRWLQTQPLTDHAVFFYQMTYLVFYVFPLVLILVFHLLFGIRPRQILSLSACVLLTITSLLLLFYPKALSHFSISVVVLIGSIFISWSLLKTSAALKNG